MIGLAWNYRGLGHPSTVRSLKGFIGSHRPLFVFLSEVKCSNLEYIKKIVAQFGFQHFEFSPPAGRAGGLLLMWKDIVCIKIIVTSLSFINCMVFSKESNCAWKLTCVYGPPIPSQRNHFWDSLDLIGSAHNGPWCLIGDFNSLLNAADKKSSNAVATTSSGRFRRFLDEHGLIDLGFEGHAFTWNNKRGGCANIQERLDRSVVNEEWRLMFPEAKITHLTALQSDHRLLLLHTNPPPPSLPKPFKFESMWIGHQDTTPIIEEAWNRHTPFLSRLKTTKLALKEWNTHIFGKIPQNITNLKDSIYELQSQVQDHNTIQAEQSLQHELDEVLKREEALWKDKAKTKWLEEVDTNTRFFHLTTIIHRRYNSINTILSTTNVWLTHRQNIGNAFVEHFRSLFSTSHPQISADFQHLILPVITPEENQKLCAVPLEEEIQKSFYEKSQKFGPGRDDSPLLQDVLEHCQDCSGIENPSSIHFRKDQVGLQSYILGSNT